MWLCPHAARAGSCGASSVTVLKNAATERKQADAEAARQGYLIAGAHLPFPGLGHVRTQGKAYAWVPVNVTIPR